MYNTDYIQVGLNSQYYYYYYYGFWFENYIELRITPLNEQKAPNINKKTKK